MSFNYKLVLNSGSVTFNDTPMTEAEGLYSTELEPNGTLKIVLTSAKGDYTTTAYLTNIQLFSAQNITVTFKKPVGGNYTVTPEDGTAQTITEDKDITQDSTKSFAVSAEEKSGYKFLGWYNETTNQYVSYSLKDTLVFTEDATVYPVFGDESMCIFQVGSRFFNDLNDADTYAREQSGGIIILITDGILPSGDYTISSGNTLLIPYESTNKCPTTEPETTTGSSTLKPYRTMTMSDGASITVNGAVSVAAQQHSSSNSPTGNPTGDYGWIKMLKGSSITVKSGGNLYAWGFITGEKNASGRGTVMAESGATVYECFQIADWRGGTATSFMTRENGIVISGGKEKKVFPISQYYVQNIEVPLTLKYGALEKVNATIATKSVTQSVSISFMGKSSSGALFQMSSGTLTKTYDPSTDRMIYDASGNVELNKIELSILTYSLNSEQYVLPVNSNMTLNIRSGTTTASKDVELLPGVQINIDSGATLNVSSGSMYIYDLDQWGNYAYTGTLFAVPYTPTKTGNRSLTDAVIDVNGTLMAANGGKIYTTSSGADIKTSKGTGKVVFSDGAGTATTTYQATQSGSGITYVEIPITSAKLHNGTRASVKYTLTDDAKAVASYTYCTVCDMWVKDDSGAAHIITNGAVTGHAETLQSAVGKVKDGSYIQMIADSKEQNCTISTDVYLDLNGCDVTGNVTVTGTLYGMDSKTDGYVLGTGDDAPGSITVSGTVAPVTEFTGKQNVNGDTATLHRYLDVADGSTHTFHRFNISVTDYYLEVLSTGSASIGFGATFRGDSVVKDQVTDTGFTVNNTGEWAGKSQLETVDGVDKLYYTIGTTVMGDNTAFAMLEFNGKDTQNSESRTVNFLSVLKTYYGSTSDTQVKNVIDKFMTAAQLTWPKA